MKMVSSEGLKAVVTFEQAERLIAAGLFTEKPAKRGQKLPVIYPDAAEVQAMLDSAEPKEPELSPQQRAALTRKANKLAKEAAEQNKE